MLFDDAEFRARLERLRAETPRAIGAMFEYEGARSTAYMKSNAPWTDRTGAARSGLHTQVFISSRRFELILAHAVRYGIWLEVCNSGRYQIILPALRNAISELEHLISNIWSEL